MHDIFLRVPVLQQHTHGVDAVSETVAAVADAASFSPSSRVESASQTVATVSEAVPASVAVVSRIQRAVPFCCRCR